VPYDRYVTGKTSKTGKGVGFTDATSRSGTAYHSEAPEFTLGF
jgi:hypothetical protein